MTSEVDRWQALGVCARMCIHLYLQMRDREKDSPEPNQVIARRATCHSFISQTQESNLGADNAGNLSDQLDSALYVLPIFKTLLPNTVLVQPESVLCTMYVHT